MIMAPVLQSLLDSLGWRNTFLVMAGMTSTLCILCFTFDSSTVYNQEDEETDTTSRDIAGFDTAIFGNHEFMKIQLASLVICFGMTNVQIFLVSVLVMRLINWLAG